MCPRCQGYLVRDTGFENITKSKPAYHCVNCGHYVDLCIIKNKSITPEQRRQYAGKRISKYDMGDDAYPVSCVSTLLLDSGHVSSLL